MTGRIINIVLIVYLVLFAAAGFYFGIAGFVNSQYIVELNEIPETDYKAEFDSITNTRVTYESQGIRYASKGAAQEAEIASRVPATYRWLFNSSNSWILIITCSFLGCLGSIVRLVKEFMFDKHMPVERRLLLLPVLGFICGFIVLAISYAIPKFLTTSNDINLDPASVMFISLLAGIYGELFMSWLENVAKSLFK
jgi:hypothetical protein